MLGEGRGAGTEDKLVTDDDCCSLLDKEATSLLFLLALEIEAESEVTSRESDDLLESVPPGAATGEPVDEDVLLLKNEKIPVDRFSIVAVLASFFCSGSTAFHPAGISSFMTSVLVFTESSHAARLLAVKRCDRGLLRTIGRFFDSLILFPIAFATCDPENLIGG